jgi:hypothetical protein
VTPPSSPPTRYLLCCDPAEFAGLLDCEWKSIRSNFFGQGQKEDEEEGGRNSNLTNPKTRFAAQSGLFSSDLVISTRWNTRSWQWLDCLCDSVIGMRASQMNTVNETEEEDNHKNDDNRPKFASHLTLKIFICLLGSRPEHPISPESGGGLRKEGAWKDKCCFIYLSASKLTWNSVHWQPCGRIWQWRWGGCSASEPLSILVSGTGRRRSYPSEGV